MKKLLYIVCFVITSCGPYYEITEEHRSIINFLENRYGETVKVTYSDKIYMGIILDYKGKDTLNENDFIDIHNKIESYSLPKKNWIYLSVYDTNGYLLFTHFKSAKGYSRGHFVSYD